MDRSLGRIPSPDDPRDWPIRSLLNVPAIAPALPASHFDSVLSKRLKDRFDQGRTGSCVGQSTGLAKRVQERRDLHRDLRFDAIAIWERSKADDGLPDPYSNRGTYPRTALEALTEGAPWTDKKGASQGWDARMRLAAYYRANERIEQKAAIFASGPIVVGMTWFDSWFSPDEDGKLPPPDSEAGGHAFVRYGFDDEIILPWRGGPTQGGWRNANSWSTGWGDEGDFWTPYVADEEQPDFEGWKLVDALDLPKGG